MFIGVPSSFPGPLTRASPPSHCLKFSRGSAEPRLTDACLIGRGPGVFYPPPDSQEIEPTMLPPYGHAASPRSLCFSPLDMPHYLFTHLWNCVDAIGQGIVGALGHGVDKGHGMGPWDDVRRAVVDRPTLLQSEFWPHPSHTIYTSIEDTRADCPPHPAEVHIYSKRSKAYCRPKQYRLLLATATPSDP